MQFSLDLQYMDRDLLVINGEGVFDTFHCPAFMRKVEDVAEHVSPRMIGYNFYQVSFINSTAMGALIMAGKNLGGRSPPIQHFLVDPTSSFVKDVTYRTGILGNVIPYKTISQALESLIPE